MLKLFLVELTGKGNQNVTARKTKLILNCLCCGKYLTGNSKQKYCSHECGVKWRTENIYRYKYVYAHRNSSPRNFLKTLLWKKNRKETLDIDFLESLLEKQSYKCAISGFELTFIAGEGRIETNASLDQIEPGKGYSRDNVQLVCRIVNEMKSTQTLAELVNWCELIVKNK